MGMNPLTLRSADSHPCTISHDYPLDAAPRYAN